MPKEFEKTNYYLYSFQINNQLTKQEFQVNLKLEEDKIVIEFKIDKNTRNTLLNEFKKQFGK